MGYSSSILGYMTRISISWWFLIAIMGLGMSFLSRKLYLVKKINKLQAGSLIFIFIYLLIVLVSTVFSRSSGDEYLYKLELFWSYRNFLEIGIIGVLFENVYNLFLLFPYGFCVKIISQRLGAIWIWITGTFISLMIELLQLALKRGYFELDDIFHNSIGVVLGILSYVIVEKIKKKQTST